MAAPTRDPARRARILSAAAHAAAANGFRTATLADIGAAAGIGGTGIYRYFGSKSELLVTLLDRLVDQLVADAMAITAERKDPRETLRALIADHLDAAYDDTELFQIYLREASTLPADDLKRIKHKMRRYVDEWATVLSELHPGLPDPELRTIIQAAIGAIQSMLNFDGRLSRKRTLALLIPAAMAVLETAAEGVQGSDSSATRLAARPQMLSPQV